MHFLGSLKSRQQTAYRYILMLASSLKFLKKCPAKTLKIATVDNPTVIWHPLPREPPQSANICINLIWPETRVIDVHYCCWWYRSIFTEIFGTNQKGVCYFLLVINTLVLSCTISEIWRLIGWKLWIFPTPLSFNAPLGVKPIEFLDNFLSPRD